MKDTYKTVHIIRLGSEKCLYELEALECPQTTDGALNEISAELESDFEYFGIMAKWEFVPLIADKIYAVIMETDRTMNQDEWDSIYTSLDIVAELLCSIQYNTNFDKYCLKLDLLL